MKPLTKNFFNRPTIEVAKSLLGCYLIKGKCVGKIVETEAYLWNDPAAHSFNGKTNRNSAMFGKAGTTYVYFIYGNHYCFNVVTNKEGIGEAVLIRALEPIKGIEEMRKRRVVDDIKKLCNGPGKLVQALGISNDDNKKDLLKGKLRIEKGNKIKVQEIATCRRIGISRGLELPHRFYLKGNIFVSRK